MREQLIKRIVTKEILLLFTLFCTYLIIRLIHFIDDLNFSYDQAIFAKRTLEIIRLREITLLGPATSLVLEGRQIFMGSVIYYFFALLLIPVSADPQGASLIFMFFSSIMLIPLYFGVKLLSGKNSAVFVAAAYTLFPLYIDHTKFLWNANFQLALSALTVLFWGLFNKTKKAVFLFTLSFFIGILIQFHYQYVFVLLGFIIFFVISNNFSKKNILIFLGGLTLGIAPLILFEARNHFYNLSTLFYFSKNLDKLFEANSSIPMHYYLSTSLLLLVFSSLIYKRFLKTIHIVTFIFIFLVIDLLIYLPKQTKAFGMSPNWSYKEEQKVYQIIRSKDLKDYNIANLVYDTKANVQKYLHYKDKVAIQTENYDTNRYLFIISADDNYLKNPSYEVSYFRPSKIISKWKINEKYNLLLVERETT